VNLLQVTRSALLTLRTQKLRTFLTLFGMVWGTASVVFLLSWGLGIERMIEAGFGRVGRNVVTVFAGKIGEDFTPAHDRRQLWFTRADVDALAGRLEHADLVLGEARGWYPVTAGQGMLSRDVRGVEPRHMALRGTRMAAGRAISQADLNSRRRVAVLGDGARKRLLGPRGRIGDTIHILGTPYSVIGFFARVGTQLARDFDEVDEQVWIPITTLLATGPRYGTDHEVIDLIALRARDRSEFDALVEEVRSILARRLSVSPGDKEAIIVVSPIQALRNVPLGQMRGLLFILAAATLVIGGIGILNMMLDAVQERSQEIGVRLAVGARRRDVVGQFFLETLVVTAVGGLTGLSLGVASCWALSRLQVPDVVPVPILQPWIVWLALGVMSAVGFASGVVPAWRASRVEPSITLRTE
jgi:putative ABC transport system permease protein